MDTAGILARLETLSRPGALEGMSRFAIKTDKAYGVWIPDLRALAKELGRDHDLAQELWRIDCRETRILAAMVGEPARVNDALMEAWVVCFRDWEVCDQCCMNLFEKTGLAWKKALEWSCRPEEFVKRAGFVLMARLAVSHKTAADERFEVFFPAMIREACDSRNFVKKAVNWSLRQIGKRNMNLNSRALETAREIQALGDKTANWIAADALRELTDEKVRQRMAARRTAK
jgi:3-methyladenine DNA glycosylase AlkD